MTELNEAEAKLSVLISDKVAGSTRKAQQAATGIDVMTGSQTIGNAYLTALRDSINELLADRGIDSECQAHIVVYGGDRCLKCNDPIEFQP